jgi:hypothetical protein
MDRSSVLKNVTRGGVVISVLRRNDGVRSSKAQPLRSGCYSRGAERLRRVHNIECKRQGLHASHLLDATGTLPISVPYNASETSVKMSVNRRKIEEVQTQPLN